MLRKMRIGLMAIALSSGYVYADIATCPHVATVKQQALEGGGFSYSAPGPEQRMWTGENEYADESYLGNVGFTDARLKAGDQTVICTYEGAGDAGIRLFLKSFKELKPATGTVWQGETCKDPDISKCSFEYMK